MKSKMKFELKDSGKRKKFESGAMRDLQDGKGRYDLISPLALRRLAIVCERGGKKYNVRNWEKGMPISSFLSPAIRHTEQNIEGLRDEDHLAQAAWNLFSAMHIEEMIQRGLLPEKLDDRPNFFIKKVDNTLKNKEEGK